MRLDIQSVSKTYRHKRYEVDALVDVNLSIRPGDQIMIVGESGSGKSTLLNILGLLDQAYEGTYHIDGRELKAYSGREQAHLRNRCFAYIFQDYALLENETVHDNVLVPLLYSDVPRAQYKQRIHEALMQVGLATKPDIEVLHLSGGERQRVAIARALVNRPTIILADEPTGSLDSKHRESVLDIIYNYLDDEKILIFVTHDIEKNRRGQQRILHIDKGVVREMN